MNPPAYFAPDLFAQARQVHASLIDAANAARVPRAVALSSVGSQHSTATGNILTTFDFEQQLKRYKGVLTILGIHAGTAENSVTGVCGAMEQ